MAKSTSVAQNGATGTIHLTLQGKGRVGKSLVAAVLAQYLRQTEVDVRCIDTDPSTVRLPNTALSKRTGSAFETSTTASINEASTC